MSEHARDPWVCIPGLRIPGSWIERKTPSSINETQPPTFGISGVWYVGVTGFDLIQVSFSRRWWFWVRLPIKKVRGWWSSGGGRLCILLGMASDQRGVLGMEIWTGKRGVFLEFGYRSRKPMGEDVLHAERFRLRGYWWRRLFFQQSMMTDVNHGKPQGWRILTGKNGEVIREARGVSSLFTFRWIRTETFINFRRDTDISSTLFRCFFLLLLSNFCPRREWLYSKGSLISGEDSCELIGFNCFPRIGPHLFVWEYIVQVGQYRSSTKSCCLVPLFLSLPFSARAYFDIGDLFSLSSLYRIETSSPPGSCYNTSK
jgi:hypothetical protein